MPAASSGARRPLSVAATTLTQSAGQHHPPRRAENPLPELVALPMQQASRRAFARLRQAAG